MLEPTGLDIPQVDRIVTTRRGKGPAIGTERRARDRTPMSSEDMFEDPRFGIPHIDIPVRKPSASNAAAIWTERYITPDLIGA